MKKRVLLIAASALLVLGAAPITAKAFDNYTNPSVVRADKTSMLDFTAQGYANQQAVASVQGDGFTVTFDKGTNSNAPKYYTSGTAIRVYGSNTITVASSNNISAVAFTFGSSDGSNEITANVGTFVSPNWNGSSKEIVFTIGGTSGNRRISKISVTIDDGSAPAVKRTVTFDSNGGSSIDSITVDDGSSITAPTAPTKAGKTFAGWVDSEGNPFDFATKITADITLYATWGDVQHVDLGSVDASDTTTSIEVSGKVIARRTDTNLYIQDNTGAILVYVKDKTLIPDDLAVGDSVSIVGTATTYDNANEIQNVTSFEKISTTYDIAPLTSISDISLANANKLISLKNIKLAGDFVASEGSVKSIAIDGETFQLYYSNTSYVEGFSSTISSGSYVDVVGAVCSHTASGNTTLQIMVSKISESQQHTVSFESNGGTAVASQYILDGNTASKPANPTKESVFNTDYTFENWYKDEALTQVFDFSTPVTADITLYAKYTESEISPSSYISEIKTKAQLSFNYSSSQTGVSRFEKVTADQDDWSGQYLIVYEDAEKSLAFDGSLSTLDAVDNGIEVSVDNNTIAYTQSLMSSTFTVAPKVDGEEGEYSLRSASGNYISGTTSTANASNGIKSADSDANYVISFVYANDEVSVMSKSSDMNMVLRYNDASNQNRFRFYKSGQKAISLYKYIEGDTTYTINKTADGKSSVSMQFGSFIEKEMYDDLANKGAEFGMLYGMTELIEDPITSVVNTWVNGEGETLTATADAYNFKARACTPARVNANGVEDANGSYYQFGVRIGNIPTNFLDSCISAVGYVKLNDVYYLTEEVSYSINTLASKYVNAGDTSEYSDHLGVLSWLSTYCA